CRSGGLSRWAPARRSPRSPCRSCRGRSPPAGSPWSCASSLGNSIVFRRAGIVRCRAGGRAMKFGIFDHMDRGTVPLGVQYENRLKFIEAYDADGFHAYQLAEHHATPLGMAPSPSVFLSAVAQRPSRLRFGPLVYTLPLYHPVRVYEEICMLDHMSGGRLELGVGRGAVPHEIEHYSISPTEGQARYFETYEILMK